jgi:hypothetical protein
LSQWLVKRAGLPRIPAVAAKFPGKGANFAQDLFLKVVERHKVGELSLMGRCSGCGTGL